MEHCQTTGTFLCAWYGPRGRQGWISPKGSSPTTSAKGWGHGDQDTGALTGHSEAGPLALGERVPPSLRDSIQGENDHATCPHPHARTRTRRGHCGLARCRRLPGHSPQAHGGSPADAPTEHVRRLRPRGAVTRPTRAGRLEPGRLSLQYKCVRPRMPARTHVHTHRRGHTRTRTPQTPAESTPQPFRVRRRAQEAKGGRKEMGRGLPGGGSR